MKLLILLIQVLILFVISLAGGWIQAYFALPLPGSLVGLIILFALLALGIVPVKWFEGGAEKLVAFLPIFIIPATTGLMDYGSFFLHKGSIVLLAVVICTLIILVVSSTVSQSLLKLKKTKMEQKGIEAEL